MKLTAISFENYKAFQKRESVEIRPLTILIGRNSSGKSIIARLPLQIAHSLSSRAESPLDLEFDGLSFGSSFTDMIHNRLPHGAVGIGANFLM
ncbi:MAG: ATP-binding protein, partial [Desulfobacteraceae bacterium]|nr:ATP-binding protein [Desulfobacteraceae bacterium]